MEEAAPFLLYVLDDCYVIEPPFYVDSGNCLTVSQSIEVIEGLDQRKHNLLVNREPRSSVLTERGRKVPIFSIVGFFNLLRGQYLAVVTNAKKIGCMPNGGIVYQSVHVDLLPIPCEKKSMDKVKKLNSEQWEKEALILKHIKSVINCGRFYFSHKYDLTNSCQRLAEANGTDKPLSIYEQADARFFWNKHLLKPLEGSFGQWIHPMICGHIETHKNVFAEGIEFDYIFISRRGCGRQGTRFNVRGIDDNGCVANFVETEQIILPSNDKCYISDEPVSSRIHVCSYVQTRGSIPISWSQPVTLKYMPATKITASKDVNCERFAKHFKVNGTEPGEHSFDIYGDILAINLIDQTGKSKSVKNQRELGQLYQKQCDLLNDKRLKYVWFDFHHECRKMKWENLSKLLSQVGDDLKQFGFFVQGDDGKIIREQTGVIRTNCMDNLDRTNVVQSLFGRRIVLLQLQYLSKLMESDDEAAKKKQIATFDKALNSGSVLSSPFTQFEYIFKNVWADNADAMSILYSGTPALKTDFTRTGKRTKMGLLMDGYNSVKRYYINNFEDGHRQDALDIFLGRAKGENLVIQNHEFEALQSIMTQALAVFAVIVAVVTTLMSDVPFVYRFVAASVTWAAIYGVMVNRVLKKGGSEKLGNRLLNRPCLIKGV